MLQVSARCCQYRRVGCGALAAAIAWCAVVSAAPAQDPAQRPAQTPEQIFAQYGLLGTFAEQCTPPTRRNGHIVHRAMADGRVERHVLMGDPAPAGQATIDSVTDEGGKLRIGQTGFGGRITYVIAVDRDRFRTMESRQDNGTVLVADGRLTGNNAPTQWLVRCAP